MTVLTTNKKPLYKHDCDECVYLGSKDAKDFYFCKKSFSKNDVSLIIRLSSKPSDYYSMPSNVAKEGILSGELKDTPFDICYQLYKTHINEKN